MWNRVKRLARSLAAPRGTDDLRDDLLLSSSQLRNKLREAEHILKDFDRRVMLAEKERDEVNREISEIDREVRALVITGEDEKAKKLISKMSLLRVRLSDVETRLAIVRASREKMRASREALAARAGIEESLEHGGKL